MNTAAVIRNTILTVVGSALLAAGPAAAQTVESQAGSTRYEMWLALTSWPALTDLEPVVGGSFNDLGFGFGMSGHWSYRQTANGGLMVGFEGAVMATDSDIPVVLGDLLARRLYLAVSTKYMMGEARNLSLDAGLGYHLVDIAQLDTSHYYSEFETWEESAFGPFVGFTWEAVSSDTDDGSGVTLGIRAHFLDFGAVRDEDVLGSVIFGGEAGDLDGPMYQIQIGYRWR